jgi:hypothetical protein
MIGRARNCYDETGAAYPSGKDGEQHKFTLAVTPERPQAWSGVSCGFGVNPETRTPR